MEKEKQQLAQDSRRLNAELAALHSARSEGDDRAQKAEAAARQFESAFSCVGGSLVCPAQFTCSQRPLLYAFTWLRSGFRTWFSYLSLAPVDVAKALAMMQELDGKLEAELRARGALEKEKEELAARLKAATDGIGLIAEILQLFRRFDGAPLHPYLLLC